MNDLDAVKPEKTQEDLDDVTLCHNGYCRNEALGINVKGSLSLFCCKEKKK